MKEQAEAEEDLQIKDGNYKRVDELRKDRDKLIEEITLIGKLPSNVAFGGTDGRTMYVTLQDKGNLESFRVDKPGREWSMQKKK